MAHRTSIHSLEQAIILLNQTTSHNDCEQYGHFILLTSTNGYSVVQRNTAGGFDVVFPWETGRFTLACIIAYEQGYKEGKSAGRMEEFENPSKVF